MLGAMTRRELILYATPTGDLADACQRYFAAAAAIGPTAAQDYPPHCTLTGFFHRATDRAEQVIQELGGVIDSAGAVPDAAVEVGGPATIDSWVGLVVRSPWLADLAARIVASHQLLPGDDPLRPKDWLHLSLAYGERDITPYADLAHRLVDPSAPARWEIAVWERSAGQQWRRH
jgi:ubiquitin-associated SH3 domain-containing protein